jgi:hypothetical protein
VSPVPARAGLAALWPDPRTSRWLLAASLILLLVHLALLPASLEDIDSANFALGIRDFDVSAHQPHAPGYPVFIALAKIAAAVLSVGPGAQMVVEARALALLGAMFGGLAAFPLFLFFRALELEGRRALAATLVTMAAPLFWFTAARPMSDTAGLAAALAAMALVATGYRRQHPASDADRVSDPRAGVVREVESGQLLVLGAFVAALAIGVRSQNAWLTLPLMGLALVDRIGRGVLGAAIGMGVAFTVGTLLWAVPLLAASGGPVAYWGVLRAQAVEDFAGVDMVWRDPTPRRLAFGLVHTFVQPWGLTALAVVVLALAVIGAAVLAVRHRSALLLLLTGFVPYGLFHLVFQETVTVRYALPLLPASIYMAVRALDAIRARWMPFAAGALVVVSLGYTLPLQVAYARDVSPAFKALEALRARLQTSGGMAVGMHQVFRRAVATAGLGEVLVLPGPPMREGLQLVDYWRGGGASPVWFLADPRRTDLELVDPASRRIEGRYRWRFERLPLMGGVRPDLADLVRIDSPPSWFAGEGWHVTPETLGMSERQPRREAVAYVRPRAGVQVAFLGGEYLPEAGAGPARVTVDLDGRPLDTWMVPPDRPRFLRHLRLDAASASEPDGFARLRVRYEDTADPAKRAHIRITVFNLQPATALFAVFADGWHEREYNPVTDRHWRWSSDRAETAVHNPGGDLVLAISGESPLLSFDAVPTITVRAGDRVLATASPSEDFEIRVRVPTEALERADGIVTLETDRVFVPAERSTSRDRRRLGLRIYSFDVRPAS